MEDGCGFVVALPRAGPQPRSAGTAVSTVRAEQQQVVADSVLGNNAISAIFLRGFPIRVSRRTPARVFLPDLATFLLTFHPPSRRAATLGGGSDGVPAPTLAAVSDVVGALAIAAASRGRTQRRLPTEAAALAALLQLNVAPSEKCPAASAAALKSPLPPPAAGAEPVVKVEKKRRTRGQMQRFDPEKEATRPQLNTSTGGSGSPSLPASTGPAVDFEQLEACCIASADAVQPLLQKFQASGDWHRLKQLLGHFVRNSGRSDRTLLAFSAQRQQDVTREET
eukprot:SAG22_NODE_161_length_16908_cov_39.687965_2_plen_281_part_00